MGEDLPRVRTFFVTLEGPEGGGKTTQARMLSEHLRTLGYNVLSTREPGGTPIGERIRAVLTSPEGSEMLPATEFLLFSASRAQHVHQLIRPHLERGGVVVCDRFYDSSLAYQGYGHRLDLKTLRKITTFATGGLVPDLTLLLDVPVEEGLQRRAKDGSWNRLDGYTSEFHQRVREGYKALAAADRSRWVCLDARRPAGEVWADVCRVVDERLAGGG